jgi:hypothetical protein
MLLDYTKRVLAHIFGLLKDISTAFLGDVFESLFEFLEDILNITDVTNENDNEEIEYYIGTTPERGG